MEKGKIFIISFLILFTISCQDDSDAIYLSHRLVLEVQRASDYEITFTWNNELVVNFKQLILVKTNEEKGLEFYNAIIQYHIDEGYDGFQDWYYESNLYYISTGHTSYDVYDYVDENISYYKLLAYNLNGDILISNTVNY